MCPPPAKPTRPAQTQRTRPGPRPLRRPRDEHAAPSPVVTVQALRGRRAHLAKLVAVGEELGWRGCFAYHGERDYPG
ncbi:hypothetical protein VTK56DRAFT_9590 [Thermocarpiscus australiensis]